jgi:uncharacterized membrane protein
MDAILMEWGSLLLRWAHIITGIAWIGSSFYFMHIDATIRSIPEIPQGKGGETWEVHGGGFYQVRKYLVAPDKIPDALIWHKWEAYSTWISGFFLLVWVYYLGADLYLIDPAVRVLSPSAAAAIGISALVLGWFIYDTLVKSRLAQNELALAAVGFTFIVAAAWYFQQLFSGRGALIHTGALMGTIMSGNVAMNIIPNQRKVIAALVAGEAPNPDYGKQAKTRSRHNNYLTLPVLFMMLSGHYPLTFTSPYAWVMVGFVLVAGALVRHFYNERHAGRGDAWWAWAVAAACMAAVIWISMLSSPAGRQALGLRAIKPGKMAANASVPKDVDAIITNRCSMCHAGEPVWNGMITAPKGVRLDTTHDIARQREHIWLHAVRTNAMPPNNITQMTQAERRTLAAWIAQR